MLARRWSCAKILCGRPTPRTREMLSADAHPWRRDRRDRLGSRPDCQTRVLTRRQAIRPGDRLTGRLQVAWYLQEVALARPVRFGCSVDHFNSGPSINRRPPGLAPEDACLVLGDFDRATVCHIALRCHDLDHAVTNANIRLSVDRLE